MYLAAVGVTAGELPEAARNLTAQLGGNGLDARAIYGGQAAAVMLDAIARSDGTRDDVITKLFETHVTNGLLGAFRFDAERRPGGRNWSDRGIHDSRGSPTARGGGDDLPTQLDRAGSSAQLSRRWRLAEALSRRRTGYDPGHGRSGGTGRRTGLKIRRLKGRGGSIPPFGIARSSWRRTPSTPGRFTQGA